MKTIPAADTKPSEVDFGLKQMSKGVGFDVRACSGEVDSGVLQQPPLSSVSGDSNNLSHPPGFTPINSEEESQDSFSKIFSHDAMESQGVIYLGL